MKPRSLIFVLPLLVTAPSPLLGQAAPISATTSPDADALAAQMRILADNPEDLDALIAAGGAAVRVGDTDAASAFYTRAERIAPGDPRLLAGKAALLVHTEHPGEALRLFARAAAAGLPLDGYYADRGLAYDLVGDQLRAQRDYRTALRAQPSDETTRRLALSLAVSGRREDALDLLDPLVRRSDRGGWRVRAFVLAMTGDVAGAQQIATSMLPPGMATGLQHFFELLPTLGPADRAFAVHFGELRATPERIADARLTPVLTPLPPEPVAVAPVRLAANVAPPPDRKRGKRERDRPPPVVVPAPTPVAVARPALPPPPREEIDVQMPAAVGIASASPAPVLPSPKPPAASAAPEPAKLAAVTPARVEKVSPAERAPQVAAVVASAPRAAPVEPAAAPKVATTAVSTPTPRVDRPEPARGAPERPSETITRETPVVAAPVRVTAPGPARAATADRPVRSDDAVIETIVAGLNTGHGRGAARSTPPAKTEPAPADAPPAKLAAKLAPKLANAKPEAADCLPAPAAKGRKAGKPGKSSADRAKSAKTSACPADKTADTKAGKKAKDDPAKKEPARVWVQVAGGANPRDLAKAWAAVKAKAPAAFKGKTGWSTPLRATNRVLTGPFKSDEEAQAFVNLVAKSGLSAFVFDSEAGQKIDRLGAK